MRRCDYLLLTALDDESDALAEALKHVGAQAPERVRDRDVPTCFFFLLPHTLGELVVATSSLLDMGNEAAGDYVQRLLRTISPTYLGLIGIAGAAEDGISSGRILVADRVWHYEPAKIAGSTTQHRGAVHTSGRMLLDRLKHIDTSLLEEKFPHLGPWQSPLVGTIASGDKVVAARAARDEIREAGRNVIGFEMEGHAFAAAVERSLGTERWFMIRSVQDAANEVKSDQDRKLACDRAAAFAATFLLDSDLCVPGLPDSRSALAEASGDRAPAHANDVAAVPHDLAPRLAHRLLLSDPAALLEELRSSTGAHSIMWAGLRAEAGWLMRNPEECRVAAGVFIPELLDRADGLASVEAQLIRLWAWSEWKLGNVAEARSCLERHMNRVGDVGERGRWADLIATIRRFDKEEDWLSAVAMYQQSLSLKELASDELGYAIGLQNIAYTYFEWQDWNHARYYFSALVDYAAMRPYTGSEASRCLAHLSLAWIDLTLGGAAEIATGEQYLRRAGHEITEAPQMPLELRRAAKALSILLKERKGHTITVPSHPERGFWARLVLGQLQAIHGADPHAVTEEILQTVDEPLLARHRLLSVIESAVNAPGSTSIGFGPAWGPRPEAPWPVREWMRVDTSEPLAAVRLLESVVEFYALVLVSAKALPKWAEFERLTLGSSARLLAEWGHKNAGHPLAEEATVVATIARLALPARNAFVHSSPTQETRDVEDVLRNSATRALNEIRHLRSARWTSKAPPILEIAGTAVDMSGVVDIEGGQMILHFGQRIVARES